MGIALPIIAAITPTNIASRCQACGVTPAGTGTANQISSANPTATAAGSGLKPSLAMMELLFCLDGARETAPVERKETGGLYACRAVFVTGLQKCV